MGAVGTSADNALAESFNAALKREALRGGRRFDGARAGRLTVFRWTTRYNTRRQHSANGQQAPIAYAQQSATLTRGVLSPVRFQCAVENLQQRIVPQIAQKHRAAVAGGLDGAFQHAVITSRSPSLGLARHQEMGSNSQDLWIGEVIV